jgi:hypothetical protein
LPQEKQRQKEQIKVTDKRIFTADGEIREEFRDEISPVEPAFTPTPTPPAPEPPPSAAPPPAEERRVRDEGPTSSESNRSRSLRDKAENPGTPFTDFVEQLVMQAYMALGMLRNPYSPQPALDPAAARQMIDILTMLKEKTAGNLTVDEHDFLDTHLGELKLAFVQRTKTL